MAARTGAVWIHWADPLRVRALVVGRSVLDASDDRLEGHGLEAYGENEQERQDLCAYLCTPRVK